MRKYQKKTILVLFVAFSLLSQVNYFAQNNTSEGNWFWQYPKPQGNDCKRGWVLNGQSAAFIGRGGVFVKTTDGGKSWKARHLFEDAIDLSFLENRITGWTISNHTVYRTDDGGDNWKSIFTADSIEFHRTCFVNENIGWIVGAAGEILSTSDGGRNWVIKRVNINGELPWLSEITFVDDSTGWIGGQSFYGNAIYKTTNQGTSWSRVTNFSSALYGVETISFADKNHGWMITPKGLIRTTNGGSSWQILSSFPWEVKEIHFTDKDTGWALGTKLSKTTDGGMNWKTIDIKYSEYLYSIDFSNDTGWIGGSGGLILKSTDNGNTWLRLSERKRQFNAVHFCDTENGWAAGDSGVIMHTNDGGINWELQYQPDGGIKLNSVFAISTDKAICVGNELKVTPQGERSFGVIMKTSDRGFTWVKTLSDSTRVYNSVKFINNSGWIAGSTGNVVKTTDGGDSWYEIKTNLPDNSYFETMDFVSEKAGWIAEHNSFSLYKTVDGGGNWVNQVIDSGLSLTSFDFVDQDYGWAAGEYQSSGNFFKTTDGGNSWLAKKIPEIRDLTSVSFLNRNTGWVIGYNALFDILTSYIAKTTDGGENWSVRKLPVKNAEQCIYMVNDNVGYIAGDGILKTENGGLSTLPLSGKKSIPGGIALYQNYPNPFNPSTTIQYTINSPGHVSLKIYDILGNLVKVLVDEWQREGEHKVTWTAGNLASGIYFCRLSSGKYSETKKIMMIQ